MLGASLGSLAQLRDCDVSRRGPATCAPGRCESVTRRLFLWGGGFSFLSDTPSTRRYGAPCLIGKYSSLFLYFGSDGSASALRLWWVLLAAPILQSLCVLIMLSVPICRDPGCQAVVSSCDCDKHQITVSAASRPTLQRIPVHALMVWSITGRIA